VRGGREAGGREIAVGFIQGKKHIHRCLPCKNTSDQPIGLGDTVFYDQWEKEEVVQDQPDNNYLVKTQRRLTKK
jgi:hypothetical protein